jgi:hypothetical protein
MIPNYVQSMSNCIDVSSFYSICCYRECEGLLGSIEREIREPMATPAQLLEVVQRLIDEREDEPRNLTLQLTSQLEAVAEMHEGKVPIHGRLFQQWLHYAFPYECPYPAKRDTVDAVVISEWVNKTNSPALYTKKQVQEIVDLAAMEKEETDSESEEEESEDEQEPAAAASVAMRGKWRPATRGAVQEMSAWTMEEELYVGYHHDGPRLGSVRLWATLAMLAKLGVVVSGLMGLKIHSKGPLRQKIGLLIFGADADLPRKDLVV